MFNVMALWKFFPRTRKYKKKMVLKILLMSLLPISSGKVIIKGKTKISYVLKKNLIK